jgi:phosphatidylglycerol lysyltransferase
MREVAAKSREHSTIVIGAQPVWNPQRWARVIESRRSLRAQLTRARNKGVTIESISCAQARDHPELDGVLAEWLASRGLPPLHFLVEPRILDGVVADRRLMVARHARSTVAFLVASPVAARNGFLIEQVARRRDAPLRQRGPSLRHTRIGGTLKSLDRSERDQPVVAAPDDGLRARARQSLL